MTDLLDFTCKLAREAGQLIVDERCNSALQAEFKNGDELVTQADLKADALITKAINGEFPDHLLVSEELAPDTASLSKQMGPLWIVDPIDGTVNYAHGHAQSAISIAYAVGGRVEVGVVYNPFTKELFHAQYGKGAFLNGAPISVARETNLRRAIIATGFPYNKAEIGILVHRLGSVLAACADIRRLGSAALDICWVAAGRLDGYYESLSLWDFAAAQLIATEAGARFGHFKPVPSHTLPQFYCKNILIANPQLYSQLRTVLQAT